MLTRSQHFKKYFTKTQLYGELLIKKVGVA